MPSRHDVVVDLLAPQPTEHVVEIGCGHGVAAALVLARLTAGTYTGIDRSAAMIAAATARNREAVAGGRATFVEAELAAADVGGCDRLFAARVRTLATPGGLAVAHRWLRRGGLLLLAIDAPAAGRAQAAAAAASGLLPDAGFEHVRRQAASYDGGVLVGVTAVRD